MVRPSAGARPDEAPVRAGLAAVAIHRPPDRGRGLEDRPSSRRVRFAAQAGQGGQSVDGVVADADPRRCLSRTVDTSRLGADGSPRSRRTPPPRVGAGHPASVRARRATRAPLACCRGARPSSSASDVPCRRHRAASSNARRRRRDSASRAPGWSHAAGSAGSPRDRATRRSPKAATSAAKASSVTSMPCGAIARGYAAEVGACHHAGMEIHFLGGATTVTGSQFLLVTDRARVLVDCGMFQGSPNESIRNRIPFDFEPSELDAVLLTHAHLDHCGLLPILVARAMRARSTPRPATIELATSCCWTPGNLHEEFAKRDARWEKRHPDQVAADDRKQADAYQAALDLAEDGEDGVIGGDAGAATGEHVPTTIEPSPDADGARHLAARPRGRAPRPAGRDRHRPRRAAVHRQGRRGGPAPVLRRSTTARRWRSRPGVHATFVDAGHILGSAIIRVRVTRARGRRGAGHRVLGRSRADPGHRSCATRRS